jgi:hypothetical protein
MQLASNAEEIWQTIETHVNYMISNRGRIFSKQNGILNPQTDGNGYKMIYLCENGIKARRKIHRLVAKYFVPNVNNLSWVDHIDRNKANNQSSNLRWVNQTINEINCNPRKQNKSGFTGVSFHKRIQKWQASIKINYKMKHLGYFDNIIDAVKAREEAVNNFFKQYGYKLFTTTNKATKKA